MNRKRVIALMASVSLMLTLTACNGLLRVPAGQLAYPGAKLTDSRESSGDSNQATRSYSFVSHPTAAEVLDWYATRLGADGYHRTVSPNADANTSSVYEEFSGDGNRIGVSVDVTGTLPEGARKGAWPASPRILRGLRVSSMSVTIE